MMIEARPGSFINKGGELMMRAIVGELGDDADLVVEPWIAPYRERARLGLFQKLWVRRLGPAAALPATVLPPAVRRWFGIVAEAQIDAVLDASGFRYTDDDRYGARSARELEGNARRWRDRGKTVVLLPQALGPFSHARRAASRSCVRSRRSISSTRATPARRRTCASWRRATTGSAARRTSRSPSRAGARPTSRRGSAPGRSPASCRTTGCSSGPAPRSPRATWISCELRA